MNNYLMHGGKKGMKWGYNDGRRNGKRMANDFQSTFSFGKLISYKDGEMKTTGPSYGGGGHFGKLSDIPHDKTKKSSDAKKISNTKKTSNTKTSSNIEKGLGYTLKRAGWKLSGIKTSIKHQIKKAKQYLGDKYFTKTVVYRAGLAGGPMTTFTKKTNRLTGKTRKYASRKPEETES